MEDKIIEEIWLHCQKFISFGVIDHFIRQMKAKKPHITMQKFQFMQTEGQRQTRPNYYNNNNMQMRQHFNIAIDDSDDDDDMDGNDMGPLYIFDDDDDDDDGMMGMYDEEDDYEYEVTFKEDVLISIHIQVYDNQDQKQKSITVFFLELNKNTPHKEIMNVKNHVQGILRNDLILKIYDMYYLQTKQFSHYLVVEHELVYMKLKQYQDINKKLNEEEINQIQIKATSLLNLNAYDKLYKMLDYYVVKQNDNEIAIKLNPISKQLLHLYSNCQGLLPYQLERNKQKQQQQNKNNKKMVNELENQFSLITLNKIEQQSLINKDDLLSQIERNHPELLQIHNRQIFEIISQHPKYEQFQLDKSGEDYFIFKIYINNKKYILKGQKFSNFKEAENVQQKYLDFCLEENPIFIPIIDCQLIMFEDHAYVLIEEQLITDDDPRQRKQTYTLRQFIDLDPEELIQKSKNMFQVIIQFNEKLNQIVSNGLFSNNLDFYITHFKQDEQTKCYFTNSLFLQSHEVKDYCNQKNCKHLNSNSTKMMEQFFDLVVQFFDLNFEQTDWQDYEDIFFKFIDFECFSENTFHKIHPSISYAIIQAEQMFKIKEEFQQAQVFLNDELDISIQNDDHELTAKCIQKYDVKDIRSIFPTLSLLTNSLTNSKNNVNHIVCLNRESFFPPFNNDNQRINKQIQNINFNNFQQLQKIELFISLDQFLKFNLSSWMQIQPLNDLYLYVSDSFRNNHLTFSDEQSFIQQYCNLVNLFQTKKNFSKIYLHGFLFKEFNKQIYKFVHYKTYFSSPLQSGKNKQKISQMNDSNVIALGGAKKNQYYKFFQNLSQVLEKVKTKYPFITYQVEDKYNNDKSLIQIIIQNSESLNFGRLTMVVLKDVKKKIQIDSVNCRSIERSRNCQNKFKLEKIEEVVKNWLIIEKQTSNINILSNDILSPLCWHDDTNQLQVLMYNQQSLLQSMTFQLQLCETVEQNLLQNSNYLGLSNKNLKNLHEIQIQINNEENIRHYKQKSFTKGLFNNLKHNKTIFKIVLQDPFRIIQKRTLYKLSKLVDISYGLS